MRGWTAAFVAALLSVSPALAQQEGLPGDSHGTTRLAPQQRQMLATVARNAATAIQLGNLGGTRAGESRLSQLSQSMAVTNGGLAQQLAQVAGPENLPLRERLDEAEIARLRALAGNDRTGFSRELVGWITRHYPDTIRNIESLGEGDPRYAALAEATLPQLREQLAAAQQLAQAAMEGEAPRQPH
ncbi:MAG: DUF4142 domain-containing protein [Magnetospirillum sp.]|nr:DUF4142 domain-containing protein [Magnetospirillum sp.]